MNNQTIEKIKLAVKKVESALVNRRYEQIDSRERKSRLTSQEIKKAIEEYKGQLSFAPETAYTTLRPIEITNSNPKTWAVDFDLWFDGMQSDLTLQLTIIKENQGYKGLVDDIHVL